MEPIAYKPLSQTIDQFSTRVQLEQKPREFALCTGHDKNGKEVYRTRYVPNTPVTVSQIGATIRHIDPAYPECPIRELNGRYQAFVNILKEAQANAPEGVKRFVFSHRIVRAYNEVVAGKLSLRAQNLLIDDLASTDAFKDVMGAQDTSILPFRKGLHQETLQTMNSPYAVSVRGLSGIVQGYLTIFSRLIAAVF